MRSRPLTTQSDVKCYLDREIVHREDSVGFENGDCGMAIE
jgi:hypothetical protein